MQIQGQIVDLENKRIYAGEITVKNGKITSIIEVSPGSIALVLYLKSIHPHVFSTLLILNGDPPVFRNVNE